MSKSQKQGVLDVGCHRAACAPFLHNQVEQPNFANRQEEIHPEQARDASTKLEALSKLSFEGRPPRVGTRILKSSDERCGNFAFWTGK